MKNLKLILVPVVLLFFALTSYSQSLVEPVKAMEILELEFVNLEMNASEVTVNELNAMLRASKFTFYSIDSEAMTVEQAIEQAVLDYSRQSGEGLDNWIRDYLTNLLTQ